MGDFRLNDGFHETFLHNRCIDFRCIGKRNFAMILEPAAKTVWEMITAKGRMVAALG